MRVVDVKVRLILDDWADADDKTIAGQILDVLCKELNPQGAEAVAAEVLP